jgi:transglutaminase-like putative cysteine protease
MYQPNKAKAQKSMLHTLVIFVVITLLFWEWLRPLPELTDTHFPFQFVLFFIVVLGLYLLRIPWFLNAFFSFFVMSYIINFLFLKDPFLEMEWLRLLKEQLQLSFPLLLDQNLIDLPFMVKTSAFYLLIWLLASYLFEMVFKRNKIFVFLVCTIIFLGILDTFAGYATDMAITRTVVLGFLLLAILEIGKVLKPFRGQGIGTPRFPIKWLGITIGIIFAISTFAYITPKAAVPSWPDPVPHIISYSEAALYDEGVGQGRKIGYGERDEVLGGSFVISEAVVFEAETEERHYWRGESKDIYTGKGWRDSETTESFYPYESLNSILKYSPKLYEENVETKLIHSKVIMENKRYSTIFHPGDVVSLQVNPTSELIKIESSGKIGLWKNEATPFFYSDFVMESKYPRFSIKALQQVSMSHAMSNLDPTFLGFKERYTQLPESLPQRVKDLAIMVTKDATTPYEKVKMIEGYFNANGFLYETEDIPFPEEGQDYVDQFLFETKKGYCNNFSTAMVVMVRSLGYPARWVKGFTSGEVVGINDGVLSTVVKDKNAHSWVEVYFPGIGWVPFEPTNTFSNPFAFVNETPKPSEDKKDEVLAEELKKEQEQPEQLDKEAMASINEDGLWYKNRFIIGLVSALLAGLLIFCYLYWRKMVITIALIRYRRKDDPVIFLKAYELLIHFVGASFIPKKPEQTLREYIIALEPKLGELEIRPLAHLYEEVRFGEREIQDSKKMKKAFLLWEAIMKKMRS